MSDGHTRRTPRAGRAWALGVALAVSISTSAAGAPPAEDLLSPQTWTPESQSLATADGFTATFRNPAAIGIRGPGLFLGTSRIESAWASLSVAGQAGPFAFGYQHWDDDFYGMTRDQYVLGHSARIGRHLFLGSSASWWRAASGEHRRAVTYNAALLLRPWNWASLAAAVDNVTSPRFAGGELPRLYRAGLALRPKTDRLTVTLDAVSEAFDRWEDANLRYGLEAELLDGVLFGLSVDDEKTVHLGLGLNFRTEGFGMIASRTDEEGHHAQSFYAETSERVNRTRFDPRRRVVRFHLGGSYRDEPSEGAFSMSAHRGASEMLSALRDAVDDESVSGLFLDIWGMGNMAVAQEVRSEVLLARERGKKTVAYIGGGGRFTDYLVASAADTLVMPETMDLGPFGLEWRVPMMKGLMDKLGLEFERYPCRKCGYKSAYAELTEDEVPEAYAEEINALLDDWYDQYVTDIVEARGLDRGEFEGLCDGRILLAAEARALGLVDVLAYSDVADSLTNVMTGARIVDARAVAEETHRRYAWTPPPAVAVIAAMGGIAVGENRTGFFDGNVLGSETLVRTIRKAQNDPDVRAVVLRIDSPGGSGYASDMVWYQVADLKNRTKKPVVSSMGLVAASGGYYIAMNSDRIIADPATLTGSIGVTGLKRVNAGLYGKLGFRNEVFKRGEHMDMFGSDRHTTEEEREMILDLVDDFYGVFTSKAAQGRGIPEERVYELGAGRVYTGRQALENGLVDDIGGTRQAIDIAASLAGIEGHPRVVYYHRPQRGLWERLRSLGQVEAPRFDTIFDTTGPMTYSEIAAALAESQ